MEINELIQSKRVSWTVIASIEEWASTTISLGRKRGEDYSPLYPWRLEEATDTYDEGNCAWGRFMTSLKSYCETGIGTPA